MEYSLAELKSCIEKAAKTVERCGFDPDEIPIEVWDGDKRFRIMGVGQFGVIPDVTIDIEPWGEAEILEEEG